MFNRIINLPNSNSFFLFGPRGTGKSTLLQSLFPSDKTLFIDLLEPTEEDLFSRTPLELEHRVKGLQRDRKWVVIDEIQKVPRLLDLVHRLIEKERVLFALTGSSGRKLKRGASNLLAGRAFVYYLHPMTHLELNHSFHLKDVIHWGTLPKIFQLNSTQEKTDFLRAYALTYLKEEIAAEQIIRKLNPFRNFLEVAAQSNGQILNYSKIAYDVGVDTKTIQSYFTILEDTLIGIRLPVYHRSIRKRQRSNPKFYLFDLGVKKALERTLQQEIYPKTYAFGKAFEHFVIVEIHRLNDYFRKDWTFSYLQTKDGAEIDLIIDRPGMPTALVEIKSSEMISEKDVAQMNRFKTDIKNSEAYCLSLDSNRKMIGQVNCLPWETGLKEIGFI